MVRLFINIIILTVILMCIDLNESRSLLTEGIRPLQAYSPIDRLNFPDVSSSSTEEDTINTERHKRNCFLYAAKSKNRAPKWMCW
ncbi:unnamed protein product [Adineta steineri]|uniref:Uncharacterized protein n=4 Tax=Adineta steineri TaxID=433720 RepID=A0A814Z9A1_9BILA|nr:unnamed protein product [Adineta steineri]CAF3547091.1 unnamed protein product [Adineta steineri]CAF3869625.1 unnamed protein product [Adineta steineri]